MSVQAELDCDEVIRKFPAHGTYVQVFSHIKPDVAGIPDRRYYIRGVALWWEVKVGRDRLSKEQYAFLEREHKAGSLVGCGDAAALRSMVYGSVPSTWREAGWGTLQTILARGFRKE